MGERTAMGRENYNRERTTMDGENRHRGSEHPWEREQSWREKTAMLERTAMGRKQK